MRRINDLELKNNWLSFENQALSEKKMKNTELREERKKNIENQRNKVFNDHVSMREQKK